MVKFRARKKYSVGEKIFLAGNYLINVLLILAFIVPFVMILSASFSSNRALLAHGMTVFPKELSVEGYVYLFKTEDLIWTGLANTIFLAVASTALMLAVNILLAYPLSKKYLPFKDGINLYFIFTMLFSGGLIPSFILINNLGLYNSLWALILPGAVNIWNMTLIRNYFVGIPSSLEESAKMDGAGDFTVLFKIYLPLSKSVLATVTLFSMVGQWNNWFGPMVYLKAGSTHLYPLAYIVRELLFNVNEMMGSSSSVSTSATIPTESLQNAAIIISIAPIIILYPFLQKYFIGGVVMGSVKE